MQARERKTPEQHARDVQAGERAYRMKCGWKLRMPEGWKIGWQRAHKAAQREEMTAQEKRA